jgi:para-nitrobenzyl esterase
VEYGAPCMQSVGGKGWNEKLAAASKEDCLFLNVWTSEWPAKSKKPVMFWIHGGGNAGRSAIGSTGTEPSFDGERLSRHGVVVVTINYRLGVFGFISHPELSAASPHKASGNYGLMDQIAALKWVRDNIAKFGGDASNVTVFGQSAGAQDTGMLMASPLARGLFHKTKRRHPFLGTAVCVRESARQCEGPNRSKTLRSDAGLLDEFRQNRKPERPRLAAMA